MLKIQYWHNKKDNCHVGIATNIGKAIKIQLCKIFKVLYVGQRVLTNSFDPNIMHICIAYNAKSPFPDHSLKRDE